MKKIGSVIEKIYFGIGAAAMGLLAVLVIFTVIMRYCFSLSWKSVSEFNVVLFAFTTFWGLGLNVLKNEHVSINILYDKFKPAVKRWVSLFNYLVMLVVDFLFVRYSWQYTAKMRENGQADQPGHGDPDVLHLRHHAGLRRDLHPVHPHQDGRDGARPAERV